MEANGWPSIIVTEYELMNALWAKEKLFGYGVTVNIAASHVT